MIATRESTRTDAAVDYAVPLHRLPIFPLPDVVLFPHALLALHVFEPRYRALTRDVLAGDRQLSVVRLRPGYEADYEGRPPVCDVAGVGEIIQSEALADGRYNILLRGLQRVRIERELPPELLYRVVAAQPIHDDETREDLAVSARALAALAERLAAALPQGGDALRTIARDVLPPGALADVLGASVVIDPDARQALLETFDAAQRIARVSDAIVGLLRRLPSRGAGPAN
jgi:Lon protease-like protein